MEAKRLRSLSLPFRIMAALVLLAGVASYLLSFLTTRLSPDQRLLATALGYGLMVPGAGMLAYAWGRLNRTRGPLYQVMAAFFLLFTPILVDMLRLPPLGGPDAPAVPKVCWFYLLLCLLTGYFYYHAQKDRLEADYAIQEAQSAFSRAGRFMMALFLALVLRVAYTVFALL